jgi:low affinity Fe/Cu permease
MPNRGARHLRPGTGRGRHDSISDQFRRASDALTRALGTPWALLAAVCVIGGWAITGPLFRFSDTWQLVINTATTIITFLMVFVIQTSQNRQAKATQLKLDELIQAMPGARNRLIVAEEQSEEAARRDELAFRRAARRQDNPTGSDGPTAGETSESQSA